MGFPLPLTPLFETLGRGHQDEAVVAKDLDCDWFAARRRQALHHVLSRFLGRRGGSDGMEWLVGPDVSLRRDAKGGLIPVDPEKTRRRVTDWTVDSVLGSACTKPPLQSTSVGALFVDSLDVRGARRSFAMVVVDARAPVGEVRYFYVHPDGTDACKEVLEAAKDVVGLDSPLLPFECSHTPLRTLDFEWAGKSLVDAEDEARGLTRIVRSRQTARVAFLAVALDAALRAGSADAVEQAWKKEGATTMWTKGRGDDAERTYASVTTSREALLRLLESMHEEAAGHGDVFDNTAPLPPLPSKGRSMVVVRP